MSQSHPSRLKRIPELDGLRAFSVLCVVIFHMCNFSGSLPRGAPWIAAIVSFLGPEAVNVFFIISGFIITRLLMREKSSFGRVSLISFYIRRFFRIVPPFATYLCALLALRAFGLIQISSSNLLWSGLFFGDTSLLDSQAWFVAHTWSLSVEEQFYLIFPPLLCIVLGFRARPVVLFLGGLYGLCVVSLKLAHELSLHLGPLWINVWPLYHFRYIIVGVFLATHGASILALLSNRSRMWPLSFAVIAFLLKWAGVASGLSVLFSAIEPCFCGLFVMWFMQNPGKCRPLRWPAIQWIGACSYSIYLWQQLFTGSADYYSGWGLARSPWSILAIGVCAALSFYFVERPGMRLGRFLSVGGMVQK